MVGTNAFFLWNVRGRIAKADPDFTAFYTAGTLLREGRGDQIYNARAQEEAQRAFAADSDIRQGPLPYIHPAYEGLLFLPLTFLPYREAFVVWDALNLGMLFAISLMVRRTLPLLQPIPLWEWVLALLAFFPVFANFLQGQDAILMLLLLVLSFRALDSKSEFIAGCWLGLGVFRFHLVIPLVLIFGMWKYTKLIIGFAATASSALVISITIVGWRAALRYPAYIWHWTSLPGFGKMPPSLMPNLLGLVTGWPLPERARWPLSWGVLVGSAALVIAVARMRNLGNDRNRDKDRNLDVRKLDDRKLDNDRSLLNLSFACAVIASVLAGYNTGAYDLSLLVLPIALIVDHCLGALSELPPARIRLILPCVQLLISPLWFLLWRRWERINLMAIFLLWWLFAIRQEIERIRGNVDAEPAT
jgi:hypothetical protein